MARDEVRFACEEDPELFFEPNAAAQKRAVDWYCLTCPHIEPCRKMADDNHEHSGVWGAETERQRHARWKREAEAKQGQRRGPR